MLPVGEKAEGKERLMNSAGLELREEDGKLIIDNVVFGGVAEKQKLDFDWEIASVQIENDRPSKQWFYLVAIGLLAIIWFAQKGRIRKEETLEVKHV
jgi:hypothetical protein